MTDLTKDFDYLISELIIAVTYYALNIHSQEKADNLIAAYSELRTAIHNLQDQAAVGDIDKIVKNLVEMRSILNGKRVEELEKQISGKTTLEFEETQSGEKKPICQNCRNIVPLEVALFTAYHYCPICGKRIER